VEELEILEGIGGGVLCVYFLVRQEELQRVCLLTGMIQQRDRKLMWEREGRISARSSTVPSWQLQEGKVSEQCGCRRCWCVGRSGVVGETEGGERGASLLVASIVPVHLGASPRTEREAGERCWSLEAQGKYEVVT
jgi:hypothetical protein